jgi:hypothetical protein
VVVAVVLVVELVVDELVELEVEEVEVLVELDVDELDVEVLVELDVDVLVVVVVVTQVPRQGFGPGLAVVPRGARKSHVSPAVVCRMPSPQIVHSAIVPGARQGFAMPG